MAECVLNGNRRMKWPNRINRWNEAYRNTRNVTSNAQRSNVQIISKVVRLHRSSHAKCKLRPMLYLSSAQIVCLLVTFFLRNDKQSKSIWSMHTVDRIYCENAETNSWIDSLVLRCLDSTDPLNMSTNIFSLKDTIAARLNPLDKSHEFTFRAHISFTKEQRSYRITNNVANVCHFLRMPLIMRPNKIAGQILQD